MEKVVTKEKKISSSFISLVPLVESCLVMILEL